MASDNSPGGQVTVPNQAAMPAPQAQTEQPDQYQLRELAAQETMAGASIWMAAAAALTLIVTTLGTILIWRQVRLTRQAVQDTSEATVAMREANAIARDALVAQSRAWLKVQKLDLSGLRYRFEGADVVVFGEVVFVIENTGNSAASDIWSRSAIGPSRGIWGEIFEREEDPHYPEALPPGGTTRAVTELELRVPDTNGTVELKPLRAGIALNYMGGGQERFVTECLYSVSPWSDGETAWTAGDFGPYGGPSIGLNAHASFLYFRNVT